MREEKVAARSPQAPSFLAAITAEVSPQDLAYLKTRMQQQTVKLYGLVREDLVQFDSEIRQTTKAIGLFVDRKRHVAKNQHAAD